MDAVLVLGHFCESHGPCVILCTQKCKEEPKQPLHSLSVPWCESCQSIDSDLAFVCKNSNYCYVTTRTPLQQDLAFLLKQAVVRSLSCEEESSKDGGTLYFGDNERGHLISHTFNLQDSLARGFHRKFSILMLMKDKIHLLNSWPSVVPIMKQIGEELREKAKKVHEVEQVQCSQRVLRQTQGTPGHHQARSLPQLTGEPAVFSHIHLWFTWILSNETFKEKTYKIHDIPIKCTENHISLIRKLKNEMNENVFKTILYCVLTGINVNCDNFEVLQAFRQFIPIHFKIPNTGTSVILNKNDKNEWSIEWNGVLPNKLPTLQTRIEEILDNTKLSNEVIETYLTSLIFDWLIIAKDLSWTPNPDQNLLKSLGVNKHDLPLLAYWTSNC